MPGSDFNDPAITAEALDHALAAMRQSGVTACLPTLITAERRELEARFSALDEAVTASRLGPEMIPGYHLEGPFLNDAQGLLRLSSERGHGRSRQRFDL